MIRLGRFMLDFRYWREPLKTQHHNYKDGRPRTGRWLDWHHVLSNHVGPWHFLWIYTRRADGQPLGRTIEWCWRPVTKL